jgi:hypothetical protein
MWVMSAIIDGVHRIMATILLRENNSEAQADGRYILRKQIKITLLSVNVVITNNPVCGQREKTWSLGKSNVLAQAPWQSRFQ